MDYHYAHIPAAAAPPPVRMARSILNPSNSSESNTRNQVKYIYLWGYQWFSSMNIIYTH